MNLPWKSSCKTLLFDTPSGWLEPGTYSFDETKSMYFVLQASELSIPGRTGDYLPLKTDVSKLTEVHIIGTQALDEYVLPNGKVFQQKSQSGNVSPGLPSVLNDTDVTTLEAPGLIKIAAGIAYL